MLSGHARMLSSHARAMLVMVRRGRTGGFVRRTIFPIGEFDIAVIAGPDLAMLSSSWHTWWWSGSWWRHHTAWWTRWSQMKLWHAWMMLRMMLMVRWMCARMARVCAWMARMETRVTWMARLGTSARVTWMGTGMASIWVLCMRMAWMSVWMAWMGVWMVWTRRRICSRVEVSSRVMMRSHLMMVTMMHGHARWHRSRRHPWRWHCSWRHCSWLHGSSRRWHAMTTRTWHGHWRRRRVSGSVGSGRSLHLWRWLLHSSWLQLLWLRELATATAAGLAFFKVV
mmetsp:Transcript_10421/g.17007  ORF Transcript_10421/g.17007 Transcript_10421/m.17007 type:complete len:282 (+) Transcript_10421:429-1274(+)